MMSQTSFPKTSIKVVLLEGIHSHGVEMMRQEGFQVTSLPGALGEKELIEVAADAHILGIRSKTQITKGYLEQAKKLLSVGCFCIGTNQVDLKSAKTRGVPVFNAPYSNTRSVAELILAEVVMLARQASQRSLEMHKGIWKKIAKGCFEVRGKTLGIVGYGHIGSQVSVLAESFGMQVVYYDIVTKMPMGNSRQLKTLRDVLSQSDFVTLHVPETPQTMGMIGADELAVMKKSACLLNASRGSVVQIPALVKALKNKNLSGAALDVFPEEPESNEDPFKSELVGTENVILTPHIGGSTEEAQQNIGGEVATSLIRFLNNGNTTSCVNFPQVDLPTIHDTHRILNVHKNVPGVLKDINKIISDRGANIHGQYLATDSDIGYLIVDVDKTSSDDVKEQIKKLSTSIKTRVLY